ncbi:hypothetical protein Bbelb_133100 [Branchiostoma belcheri]|nr:hypothetical protein Bbelb_133100 [Branchiostoma belcheri]
MSLSCQKNNIQTRSRSPGKTLENYSFKRRPFEETMETVDDSYIARAAAHLHNADRESEAADCIEPRAELPLPVRTNHQAGMTGKETPMSQLYGDTTGHKESAKPAGQRWGEEYGKESSKTVSRLYEDTTNINDSTSPVEDEDSDKNRPTPGLYEHGGQKSPDASSCLYENSTETSADHKETQSTMYEGGNPEIKHQTGSTANSGSIPSSTPQRATATGEAELEHHYENIDAPRENVQNGNPTSEEGADALKDDNGFCFTWMFPTTCSRLTCVLAITAAIACIVALTVFGLKTTSNPKSQAPVFPTETHHLSHWSTSFVTSDSGNESSVPPTEAKREYYFKATFTTLGAKGRLGPTDLGQHYSGQDHDGLVTLNNGIQHFTVKHTGTYQIEAAAVRKLRTSYASQSFFVSFVNAAIRTAHVLPGSTRACTELKMASAGRNLRDHVIAEAVIQYHHGIMNLLHHLLRERRERRRPRERITWVRSWIGRRQQFGVHDQLMVELRNEDTKAFTNFLHMSPETYDELLERVGGRLTKNFTFMRLPMEPGLKLALTLRHLASGNTYMSMKFAWRVPHNTISVVVREVCQAIIAEYMNELMVCPSTLDQWRQIADRYYKKWNFPHTCGAIDGKHVAR